MNKHAILKDFFQKIKLLPYATICFLLWLIDIAEEDNGHLVVYKNRSELARLYGLHRAVIGLRIKELKEEGLLTEDDKDIFTLNI